jgi:hypothetical protein
VTTEWHLDAGEVPEQILAAAKVNIRRTRNPGITAVFKSCWLALSTRDPRRSGWLREAAF